MLDWDMILDGVHEEVLRRLYAEEPLEELSERLGVSKLALRAKIMKEGIQLRPRGGVDPMTRLGKSRLDCLDPEMFKKLTPREISKQFDMCPSAVHKYIRKHKLEFKGTRENISRQSNPVQTAGVQSTGGVDQGDVEAGQGQDDEVHKGDVTTSVAAGEPHRVHREGD